VIFAVLALTVLSGNPLPRAVAIDRRPAGAGFHSPVTVSVASTEPAYFLVGFAPGPEAFTIMLTDTVRIQEARDIVSGIETDAISVIGTVVKAPAPYNPPWSYQLDPASIRFFEVAIEVCDASPEYVEDHLSEVGEAFLPGSVWCPWSSRVVAEMEVGVHSAFLPVVLVGR
jgi:hypothetical protein